MRSGFNSPTAHNFMLAPARFFLLSAFLFLRSYPRSQSSFVSLSVPSLFLLPPLTTPHPLPPPRARFALIVASPRPDVWPSMRLQWRLALWYMLSASISNLESRKAKIESRPRISNRESRCESPFSSRPNIERRLSAELVCVVGIGVLCVFVCVCCVFVLVEVVVCMLGIAPLV